MSDTDPTVAPAPTQEPATSPPPASAPALAAPPATDPPAVDGGDTPPPTDQSAGWAKTRIDQLTREKWDARREAQRLASELAALRAGVAVAPAPVAAPATPAPAAPAAAAPAAAPAPAAPAPAAVPDQAAIAQYVAAQRFNERCNEIFEKGTTAHPDFKDALKGFDTFGGLGAHPAMLQAATALPNAEDVLHTLGKDLDRTSRILELPPVQQAVELTRLSVELQNRSAAPSPQLSNAPPPIRPVSGAPVVTAPNPDANGDFKSQEEFKRWRATQRKGRR